MIGKTLAHYEITGRLGKGGMGEVFRARDAKLGREVAIKVLPEEFARDTDRVARFQREAKLLASLNHPNIAAIHGLEESGGTQFLVLELVEGETLAERLKRGSIQVEDSLKLALQIAEALAAAHEKGVIHRDLKPANIKVTPEGKVKVLDFGLAKAYSGEQEQMNLSNSPTLSDAATQQGVILGTAAYMSPEQARGKAVDKRTDIWAFGCVLYEMLAGQAAFQGEDVTEILAAVVKLGANLDLIPANIHPRVREVLTRCLQKEQKKRYPDIGEARYEIEQVLADPGGVFVQPASAAKPRKQMRLGLPWIAAVFVLGLIVAGLAVWKLKPSEPRRIIRLDHVLPEDQQFNFNPNGIGHTLAVSPDGTQFAYSTSKGLYLRSMDQLSATFISGTGDNPQSPFFSPDGQWLGYWSQADSKLKKISIRGGAPVTLCDVNSIHGAIWYADNTIVYADVTKGVMRVSANAGVPEILERGTSTYPQFLPDGKSLLFADVSRIIVRGLESGERKVLFTGGGAFYLPTGHLVYWVQNNTNLFAAPFDLRKLEVTGGTTPIVENADDCAISESGTLIYIPATVDYSKWEPVWVDRNGKEEPSGLPPNRYSAPSLSPDGTRLALTAETGENSDIWIWDFYRKTLTRFTFEKGEDGSPLWSPDGKRIVFASNRGGKPGVYWKAADGTGEAEILGSPSGSWLVSLCWAGNAKTLVFEGNRREDNYCIASLSTEGDRAIKPLLEDKSIIANPNISPDGKWMAYMSQESGQTEIYVRPFPNVNSGKWQISTGSGAQEPRWSPSSRELFYRSGDAMMAVSIETDPTFKAGVPTKLFQGNYYSNIGHNWDISPDGKRFLMIKPIPTTVAASSSAAPRPKINIVINWFEELKQRVPVK